MPKPYWSFNEMLDGVPTLEFMLSNHQHVMEKVRNGCRCSVCHKEHEARLRHLRKIGYATQAEALLASLVGRNIKAQQFKAGPWIFCRVTGYEYPNCCIEAEDLTWAGETFPQRSRWLRFGWCGVLDDESRFEEIREPQHA
jgi:hypothetical protein